MFAFSRLWVFALTSFKHGHPSTGSPLRLIRSRDLSSEQGLIARQKVRLIRICARPQPAAFEQPGDPASDASRHANHFTIAGRTQFLESNLLPIILIVDPIEYEAVETDIQIDSPAKGLHEG